MERTTCILLVLFGLLSIATCANGFLWFGRDEPTTYTAKSLNQHRRIGADRPTLHAFSKRSQRPGLDPSFHAGHDDAQEMAASRWEDTETFAMESAATTVVQPRIFYAIDNGADPTGSTDSTTALQMTINQAFEVASTHSLLTGVIDLGGVEVHLGGGQYVISRPLSMPDLGGGNLLIHGGTLRASSSFPSDGYLIELASSDASEESDRLNGKFSVSPVYEDVILRDLMLDANFIGGGILVMNSLRTTIDNCYITHFGTNGILVQGGHETMIHNSFLGQHITAGGDPQERSFSGTAIVLAGNDNAVTDVVIFSAAVGILVSGQANIITGVHCYNKATGWGGVGIHVKLPGDSQARIVGCYMDYTGIVLDDPSQVTITNSFFLGDANVLLRATSKSSVFGVAIVDNMFSGGGKGVPIVQLDGNFSSIQQTVVDRNSASGMALRSTRARSTVRGLASNWTMDFSKTLLFPNTISNVQYSFYTTGSSFPRHVLRSVANNQVVVEADMEVDGTVAAMVDQSDTDGEIYKAEGR